MKGIASRTAGPDVNEFLNNQKTGRLLPDVESANDGSQGEEAGTPRPSPANEQSRADPWNVAGRYRNVRLLPVSTDQASAASAQVGIRRNLIWRVTARPRCIALLPNCFHQQRPFIAQKPIRLIRDLGMLVASPRY